jgi:hypothetical protein
MLGRRVRRSRDGRETQANKASTQPDSVGMLAGTPGAPGPVVIEAGVGLQMGVDVRRAVPDTLLVLFSRLEFVNL